MKLGFPPVFTAASCRLRARRGCLATCQPAARTVLECYARHASALKCRDSVAVQRRDFVAQAAEKPRPSRTERLMSAKNVNVGKLAGAIAKRISEHGVCSIDCVGAMPIYSAMKAVSIASGYLGDSHPGQKLCVHHEWVTNPAREAPSGRQTETKLLRVHVRPVAPPSTHDEPELILIGADTNTGLAAGLISRVIEEKGVAAVAGMGSFAISNAVKAMAIAQTYLEKQDALGERVIGAVVRTETFKEDSGAERKRMVLSCIRITDPGKAEAE
eukprot:TRINITY_DN79970_c0_g1_i1.p1 TRINITY_DN79970_c0_g1~~TRINITY_DN79970_c0_g1_i1.p1  ORF type:complete len:283 (+),score=31.07 TRINITY_DN79970_c0_g1_i1:36-851(+)